MLSVLIAGTYALVLIAGTYALGLIAGTYVLGFIEGLYFVIFLCNKILEAETASRKNLAIIIFVSTRFFGKHGRIGNTMP